MSNSLEEFQHIIDQLVPVIQATDFDELFKGMTNELTKPQQFQIKMELNRLKKSNSRFIDLRGHVDGEVGSYEYQGQIHYLDYQAIKVFEREIGYYGEYTTGVYEQTTSTENNHRVKHRKEQQQRLIEKDLPKEKVQIQEIEVAATVAIPFKADRIQFQSYAIRSEERMNYSISVELELNERENIKGTSSDLSVSGSKVKLPIAVDIAPGQLVKMHFRGLEEEFALGLSSGIEYEVVATEDIEPHQYVRMKRTYGEKTQAFNEFLNNFINGNKRRYKVNMENTEEAVIIKGYEQYYMPRITSLPLFIGQHEGQYAIKAVLTTENNKFVLRYWRNHEQQIVLSEVFNHKRIERLIEGEDPHESILYSFTHSTKGRITHYAALIEELESDEHLKHLFFSFGARKANWRVHKVQLMNASYDSAHIPLSLPDSASDEVKFMNRPPSARVAGVLHDTSLILALTDITELKTAKQYQSYEFNKSQANDLKIFGLPINKAPLHIEEVAVDYVNLRKETRFLYDTEVTIEQPQFKAIKGNSLDFSTKGMQIELDAPCELVKTDVVLVTLPQLQKITTSFKLNRLPYEVVMVSKNRKIVNIRVYEQSDQHVGKKFFQQLIQGNRTKLTAAEESDTIPGLPLAMRNMYVNVCANMPFFIHRKGVRFSLDVIGRGGQDNSLHKLMAKFAAPECDYTSYPLALNDMVVKVYTEILKTMKRQDAPNICEFLLRVKRNERQIEEAMTIEVIEDLRIDHSHIKFIDAAQEDDLFFAYRIHLSRTGRPDVDYIAKELKYVGNYAKHRARVLEEQLWGVIGVADAIDISDEMLLRYGFSDTDIKIQQQAKQFFFDEVTNLNL
ncbi:MAG: hypothetical protein ACI8WB_001370 [Phenylobacterium sp.]|jgi:hypothetical protein